VCSKFLHQAMKGRIKAVYQFSRWRWQPSWKMAAYIRFRVLWTQHVSLSLYINFIGHVTNGCLKAILWFSRWQRPLNCKMAANIWFRVFFVTACFLVCVPNLIEINWPMADLEHCIDFQDSSRDHLWIWRYTPVKLCLDSKCFLSLRTKFHWNWAINV
jgi:hypothetical protein